MQFESLSDQELIDLTLRGDKFAFDQIVYRYQKPIFRYCFRLLNNNQLDAEDVTSESLFKAFRYLATYKSEYKFSSWLYRIAHNQAVSLIKKKAGLFFVDIENFWHFESGSKDETKLTNFELENILDKLKTDDKAVLVLFYLEEKSLSEIGDILKISDNAVAQRLSRARKKARDILQKLKLTKDD
jgi:RNA polymerase sigma factor (sigma-70 family)